MTVKSFSSDAGIQRPGFQLLSLIPPDPSVPYTNQKTHADRPCFLPDQAGVYYRVYLPLAILTLLFLFVTNVRAAWQRWTSSGNLSYADIKSRISPGLPSGEFTPMARRHSERPVPLSLPSRKSSQHLGGTTSMTPTSSSIASRPQRLGPPLDLSSRSAPVSPMGSPRLTYADEKDDDMESVIETPNLSRRSSYIYMNGSHGDESSAQGLTSEPSSYFLPLPNSSGTTGLGLAAPAPGMTSRRNSMNLSSGGSNTSLSHLSYQSMQPAGRRPMPRALSAADWASAAKAKEKSVLGVMMDSLPVPGTARRGKAGAVFGWETVKGFLNWAWKSRNGVVGRSWKEALAVSWPPAVVWVIVNALFFLG